MLLYALHTVLVVHIIARVRAINKRILVQAAQPCARVAGMARHAPSAQESRPRMASGRIAVAMESATMVTMGLVSVHVTPDSLGRIAVNRLRALVDP
jgi:hypothetical protein